MPSEDIQVDNYITQFRGLGLGTWGCMRFPKLASSIKSMDSGKRGARVRGLTGDTANAFRKTLHDIVYIVRKLLDLGFDYVLSGKIQSDRLEGSHQ